MSPAAEAEMVWLKSALTGLVAAIVTVVAIVAATATFFMSAGEGSGIGAVTFGVSALLLFPAALAFALGFRWMFRRQQRLLTRPARPTSPTTPTRMAP
jgi:hypothetical protein